MNSAKTGTFISTLRKQKSLTQKQLAEQLGITDKAISKWERGLGYPDIETVLPLAKALGVTANEILMGEKVETEKVNIKQVNTIVNEVVKYSKSMSKLKTKDFAKKLTIALSSIFMLTILICGICDIAINDKLSWSYYVIGGLVVAWFTLMPLINLKRNKWLVTLIGLAITSIPYLYLIESLITVKGWVSALALPLAIITIGYLFIVICIFSYLKFNKWYLSSFTALLLIPYSIIGNTLIERYVGRNIYYMHNIMALIFIVVTLSYVGYHKSRSK